MSDKSQDQKAAVEIFYETVKKSLMNLSQRRPVFHSEADLQHEFAREYHSLRPVDQIRLERPIRIPGTVTFNVDMLVKVGDSWCAIELIYITAALSIVVLGETFTLSAQAAQDLRRYDIIKDIVRLESLLGHGSITAGVSITITNDRTLWGVARHSNPVDAEFRFHHGRTQTGMLAWSERASMGTRKGREATLEL